MLEAKARAGTTVSVCIPARDEGSTVGSVVRAVVQPFLAGHGGNGLVDEVIVLDDGSRDDTAEQARDAGASVVAGPGGAGGKGQAMAAALAASTGDVVAFLDADVANTTPAFVTGLLGPLLTTDHVALVKGFYTRPLHGDPTGGGRVTELVARPVLELLFPELSWVRQPLAGETAAHRWVFEKLGFAGGYGVELGLLIDVAQQLGSDRLAQVDLGERIHRNRPLHELRPQAVDVLRAALERVPPTALPPPAVTSVRRVSANLVVSNRGPLTFRAGPDGALVPVPAGGGLASSLHRILAGSGTTWASVTMGAADREAVAQGLMHEDGLDLLPVVIDDETYRQAYDVVANTTLWYCHHHLFDLPHRPRFDRHWRAAWEGYRAYNRAMADVVAARAGEGDAVFVQDYHFSLLGRMLAEARPDLRTVHFLHTPFAAPDMLGVLPDDVRAELLDGMAGYSACGFHCHQWEAGFLACYAAARDAAARAPDVRGAARPRRRRARGGGGVARVRGGGGGTAGRGGRAPIIARTDRMEPSKNIVRGMLAFEELLMTYPEWRGRVVHLAFAYPSRQGLAEYLAYGADVEHTAERINHAYGSGPTAGRPLSCHSRTTGPARSPP